MIEQIRPSELSGWLRAHEAARPLVLDVREPWEVRTARIEPEGAELLLLPMGVLPARLHEIDQRRAVACLCHLGGRSMQVAAYLEHQGFAQVANIAGGIHAWSLECDPRVPIY